MSHRKVRSLGNVPFSWEKEPGVSKITHKDIGLYALDLPPPPPPPKTTTISPSCLSNGPLEVQVHDIKISIPLPPCPSRPPRRSTSLRGLWRREDPFLAAYKECTKSVSDIGKLPINDQSKRGVVGSNVRKSKFGFTCKESCAVRDDNLVRLSHLPPLPPLPRQRSRGLMYTLERE